MSDSGSMPDPTGAEFVAQLAAKFGAPTPFIAHFLEQQQVDHSQFGSPDEWLNAMPELSRFYTNYALSTNQRAVATVDECIRRHGSIPLRHLDIGAGQGGLVREFSLRGTRSTGIEIDGSLHGLAVANVSDTDATIVRGSILEIDHGSLGQFDVITCTEVIEHVHDPEVLIKRITEMLAPGGTLFLRMPNNRHVDAVRTDGHFLLFGISLLTREEAKAYKAYATKTEDAYHHMGEYYRRDYYAWLLEQAGLTHELVAPTRRHAEFLSDFAAQSAGLLAAYVVWRNSMAGQIPFFQKHRIEMAVSAYLADAFRAYADALAGKNSREFVLDYCIDFWPFIACKPQ